MAVFSHRTVGRQSAVNLLRGIVVGSFAFAAFFVVVALMIERWNIVGTYLLAALVALFVNGISLMYMLPARTSNMD